MTIHEFLKVVLRHCWVIVISTLIVALIVAAISWFWMENVYQASSTIIVSAQKSQGALNMMTYNDYTLNLKLVDSYQVLCKTNRVLSQVIAETGVPYSLEQLGNMITVQAENDTEIISIAVRNHDPVIAMEIANALADTFQKEVISIMMMDNVQIIDYARKPTNPISPNHMQNLLLAVIAGIIIGIGIAFLLDLKDYTVKDTDQVEQIINVPVLGSIPHIG